MISNFNKYQSYYLTLIYYYITLKDNNINISIDITSKLFKLKFEDIDYNNFNIMKNLIDELNNITITCENIVYNEDLTNDELLLTKYNKLKRLIKLQSIL